MINIHNVIKSLMFIIVLKYLLQNRSKVNYQKSIILFHANTVVLDFKNNFKSSRVCDISH